MARRRYISTDISTDKAIRDLAVSHGDFAALLYTWMVPHADDQGLLTSDPEELLWTVMSSFRHKTVDDVRSALDGMHELGLVDWQPEQNRLILHLGRWDEKRTDSERHRRWRKQIIRRDAFTCRRCGVTGVPLHAHHILPWASHPDLRYELSNGEALCKPCHVTIHRGGYR